VPSFFLSSRDGNFHLISNECDIVHIFSYIRTGLFSPSICSSLKLNVKINCICIVNACIICDIAFTMYSNSLVKINPTWLEECHCRNIWFFPGSCWDVDFRCAATFPRFPLLITLTYFKTGLHSLLNYCYTVQSLFLCQVSKYMYRFVFSYNSDQEKCSVFSFYMEPHQQNHLGHYSTPLSMIPA
jgi:hypothetical protein